MAFAAAAITAPGAVSPANAGQAQGAISETSRTVSPREATAPTDISARRRHYRYVGNRWRVVQPYPAYGIYAPRPYYYRPYPVFVPFPFGFGFGYNPYYW